ncbi:FimB/Mfa2 family fimbrial subunit [Parabacteroides pacaensis]|uniref:FimB/Mfa2 family fimbrial subunit n=1 Tax=Parabacteroides pacaensis TaxID=2086575 RepID=UPI000D0F2B6F|nr:FimB/Mfa2 family fimbrial subunit [Parabacteroides pacaensis]
MKKILLGLLAIVVTLVSCTDHEEIEIAYQTNMSITASHLFDIYSTVVGDEFNMKGTNNGNWNINLHAFIYDNNGNLVKSVEEQYPSLTSTLNFNLDLLPGKYSVVAIAEFSGTLAGHNYKFWNISNTEKLNDLSIVESDTICNSPFETLGITSSEFEIGDRMENILIDIRPVTGLLQVIIWDDDFSGIGKDGFSIYAPDVENLTIYAPDLKQVVKFNGVNPTYDYGDQATRYPIQIHSPKSQFEKKGPKQSLGYRALLPQENRDFYWELQCVKGAGQKYFLNGKDWQMSDLTDNKLNIQPGKQYVMDLLLDGTFLYVQDYNPEVDMFERLQSIQGFINKKNIKKALDERYDKYVGMSKNTIETYLDQESWYTTETTTNYWGTGLISSITARFTDSTMTKANRIMLMWAISSQAELDVVTEVLSEMYTPWDEDSTENIKQFINSTTLEEVTVMISWDLHNGCLYFDAIN